MIRLAAFILLLIASLMVLFEFTAGRFANKPYKHYVDGHFEHIDCSDTPYLRDLEHRRAVYVATIRGEFQGKA